MARRTLVDCPLNCGRRHYEDHPHVTDGGSMNVLEQSEIEKEQRSASGAPSGNVSVIGADSPEALAAQAETATRSRPAPKTRAEVEAELQRARIEQMRPLARTLSTVPYSAISIATFDRRWREKMREDSLASLEKATLNTMLAWGIEFSGKWSSVMALCVCHAETMGLIYQEIAAENRAIAQVNKDKKDAASKPN